MPTRPQLRAAVIGVGFIGGIHADAALLNGARIVAVGASTPERSKVAMHRFGADGTLSSPADLRARDDIDVVHICTPNDSHDEYARAALDAGIHVICEKPLATDVDSAAELTAMAASRGLVASVPFGYRFYPSVRAARSMIARGEIGRAHLIHGTYLQDWMSRPDDWNWRVDPDKGGQSRAVADIGSHWLDLAEFVTGQRIARVQARLATTYPQRLAHGGGATFASGTDSGQPADVRTEDAGAVLFETDEGAIGSLIVSQVSPGRKNRLWLEVDGTVEALSFSQEEPDSLWIGGRERSHMQVAGTDPEDAYSIVPPGHPQGYRDCFTSVRARHLRCDPRRDTRRPASLRRRPSHDDGRRRHRRVAPIGTVGRDGCFTLTIHRNPTRLVPGDI